MIREFIALLINLFFARYSERGSILMYHSVGEDNVFSTVSPSTFERQLRYVSLNGYDVIPLSEMISRINERGSLKKCISLTFDDGYTDFYTTVFPLLKQYQMHATVFVPTEYIGKTLTTKSGTTRSILTHEQIKELGQSEWVTVSAHSMSHVKLSQIPRPQAQKEIEGSREVIEKITGKSVTTFAYPFGNVSAEIVSYMRDSRWSGAVTVKPGLVTLETDPFLLPRNSVDSRTGMNGFKMKLSDGVLLFTSIKK